MVEHSSLHVGFSEPTIISFETQVQRRFLRVTIMRAAAAICLWIDCGLCQLPQTTYVGSQVCSGCHSKIAAAYRKTPMGRSMAKVNDPAMLGLAHETQRIKNDKLDRTFEVFAK